MHKGLIEMLLNLKSVGFSLFGRQYTYTSINRQNRTYIPISWPLELDNDKIFYCFKKRSRDHRENLRRRRKYEKVMVLSL